MEFVTARIMHEVTKRKEKESHGDNVALFSKQNKEGNLSSHGESQSSYNCGKPGTLHKIFPNRRNRSATTQTKQRKRRMPTMQRRMMTTRLQLKMVFTSSPQANGSWIQAPGST